MDQVSTLKDQGNKALSENKFEDAIKYYTDAINIDNKNHVLYSNRSAAHAKLQNYDLALQDAEKTVEIKPDWAKGYSRKGLALAYLNRSEEAIACYSEGLRIDPNNATLKEGLAEVKSQTAGRRQQFPNPFSGPDVMNKLRSDPRTKAMLDDPEYLKLLQQLQANPQMMGSNLQDPRVLTTLSVLLNLDMSTEPMDTEETTYTPPPRRSAPPPKPKDPEPDLPANKKLAKIEKEKGNEAYKQKDFEKATEFYAEAKKHDPTDITFYNNLAAVFFEQKAYEKCIEECEKGIEVGRENRADFKLIAKAFTRIGNAYKRLKEWRQAKVYYEKSMSEHRTPEIKSLLSAIDKFIKEDEKNAYVDTAKAEEEKEMGNDFFKKGDYASAVKHYSEAIRRNPVDAKLYSNRAACYTKLVAFDLGLKDCDECVKLDPKFLKGWIRKGHILQAMQKQSQAISSFQRALEIDPNNAEALQGYRTCTMENSGMGSDPEKVRERAMADPEVQAILRDPAMRMILEQMQNDPRALQDHLKNPEIAAKIQKLLESGLIAIH